MYYFNRDNILECTQRITAKRYEFRALADRVEELLVRFIGMDNSEDAMMRLAAVKERFISESEELNRLEYTLTYASETYAESDRRAARYSSGSNGRIRYMVKRVMQGSPSDTPIRLAVYVALK